MMPKKNDRYLQAATAREKPVILLSMYNTRNSRLIESYLSDSISVLTSNESLRNTSFDLCILDEQAFQENKQIISNIKLQRAPIFLPVLVLSNSQSKGRNNAAILEYADDVIYTPIGKHVLQARIQILLRQHEYSMQLQKKNQELEKKNQQLNIFRQAMDATNTGILITNAKEKDNPVTYCNKGLQRMTGYSAEQIKGRNCRFLQADDRDQEAIDQIRSAVENGEKGEFTLRNYRKDGTMFWNNLNLAPIKDEQGEINHFVGIQNDVTELIEAKNNLQEERDFIDAAIKSLPDIFYMVDEDLNYVKWNENMEEEFGYQREEIATMKAPDFFAEKDMGLISSSINKILKTGSAEVEVHIKHKNGKQVPYYITGKRLTRSGKNFIVGTCTNLATLKKAEYKSKQQEQLLKAIINQAESIIYVKDSNGVMRLVNDSYLELFGLKRENVIGKTRQEIFSDNINSKVTKHDRQVLRKGKAMEFEEKISIGNKDRYYHTIKYPLKGVPGFEQCICGISTNITDRKEVLNKLKERIKEQQCLYNISRLGEKKLTINQLLQKAVTYLPDGWQHSKITEACIKLDGKKFTTDNYKTTPWNLNASSNKIPDKELQISIAYTEKRGEDDEVFLKEERELIDTIAETLGAQINRILAEKKLKESEERWKKLVTSDPNFILLLSPNGIIKFLNPAAAQFLGGNSADKILGKNLFELIQLDEPERAKERIKRVISGEKLEPEVYKTTSHTGETRYLKAQSVPVALEKGQPGLQLIAQDITDRVEYELELKKSISEKEVLLQEIHHRVKNNLAVVSGLLKIQRFSSENIELNTILTHCELRIKSIALIHEKLYQSESLSNVEFSHYIEDLVSSLHKTIAMKDGITMSVNCEMLHLNVNQAVPCGLILNELVSNALEHAFPGRETGKIQVNVTTNNKQLYVEVSDNGIGLGDDKLADVEQSMGFTIVRTLISQLNATLNIQNNNGTTIGFSFERQQIKGSSSGIITQPD